MVLSGAGGVGKGTIVNEVLARDRTLWLSQSWTTRPRRPAEPLDAYHFVDRATFEAAIAAGGFLEWVEFLNYLQGTPMPDPPEGCDVILEIDVGGGRQVKQLVPSVLLVFVEAPSLREQRARMRRRGDSDAAIKARLAKAASERATAAELGYHTVVNDNLSRAVAEVESLIAADRSRRRPGGR